MRLHPAGPLLQPLLRLKPLKPLNKMSSSSSSTQPPPQLPPLPEVERLAPGCIRILGGNPGKFTLQGTNTYLVGTGASRLLIDTGEGRASWLAALRRVLRAEGATVAAALLTHWHHDHTGGVADLLAAWPGTPVHKHQPQPQPEQESEEEDAAGWAGLADGQTFRVEGATLTAAHTPGHTADHVVLFWAERGALFTGDNVLGHGTSVFEDLAAYVASLERMRRLYDGDGREAGGQQQQQQQQATAYPGHGAVVLDGPGKIAEYIRHRGQREEQVVQTLRSALGNGEVAAAEEGSGKGTGNWSGGDGWTVMELVRSIYRDVPETLHPAAAGGVAQILQKLQKEGRVVEVDDGERWRLASGSGRSAL
ncbi:beta-lactamase-like protein [Chaetomium fimeti]|uniref:Beta-lactamase-like protein n=1 Tax=Chaetomium fimeti TaxID=1854472 RepID=A0AAE0HTH7_9PEZI|nr:beta-lactamase-like protein [Chaetomium fimeti]